MGPRNVEKTVKKWGFYPKKLNDKRFMVKHNLDNHFKGVKPKFSINLISIEYRTDQHSNLWHILGILLNVNIDIINQNWLNECFSSLAHFPLCPAELQGQKGQRSPW